MISALPRRVTLVWLALVLVSCTTFWLGTDHLFHDTSVRLASALAIGLAFTKVYYIGQDFMEVREAPRALRIIFLMWLVAFGGGCVLLYTV